VHGCALALALVAASIASSVPYAPQERMQYEITYVGLQMGKARLSVGKPEGTVLPVLLEAKTTGVVGFVNIKEQLASYVDTETGLPHAASIDSIEPNYRRVTLTRFDRASNRATVRDRGRSESIDEVAVPPGTVDFVALVFRLRSLPLGDRARHTFPVLAGKTVSTVIAEVVGRETLSTKAGTFRTVKVRVPTAFNGKFSEKSPTYVWFSDDARRIVVRLSTDFAIGRALADLVEYQPGIVGG
jgi:hypothetical protein